MTTEETLGGPQWGQGSLGRERGCGGGDNERGATVSGTDAREAANAKINASVERGDDHGGDSRDGVERNGLLETGGVGSNGGDTLGVVELNRGTKNPGVDGTTQGDEPCRVEAEGGGVMGGDMSGQGGDRNSSATQEAAADSVVTKKGSTH